MQAAAGPKAGAVQAAAGYEAGAVQAVTGSKAGAVQAAAGSEAGAVQAAAGSEVQCKQPQVLRQVQCRQPQVPRQGAVQAAGGPKAGAMQAAAGSEAGVVQAAAGPKASAVQALAGVVADIGQEGASPRVGSGSQASSVQVTSGSVASGTQTNLATASQREETVPDSDVGVARGDSNPRVGDENRSCLCGDRECMVCSLHFLCHNAGPGGAAEEREPRENPDVSSQASAKTCQESKVEGVPSEQMFKMSRCPSEAELSTVPGDPLFEWYSTSESDWEECDHLVPEPLSQLRVSPSCEKGCDGEEYSLESVSWPLRIDVERQLQRIIHEHQFLSRQLEREELLQSQGVEVAAEACEHLRRMRECEHEAARLSKIADASVWTNGSPVLTGLSKSWVGIDPRDDHDGQGHGWHCSVRALTPAVESTPETQEPEEILQTKTIPGEIVRQELTRWIPAMQSEYESLVTEMEAVEPLSDESFKRMSQDPNEKLELIPGKVVFTIKAFSGRLKARAVACGCFQNSQARGKEHTFASGISAEAARLLLRKAGLSNYAVGSIDIKTAFLNAPVVTPNDEKVIVRVPGIMRQAGVCAEKFWLVRKALYGLDVAPRSWTLHRNASLKEIHQLECGKKVKCEPLPADSNIWRVSCKDTGELVCYLGLYVDDVLLIGPKEGARAVASVLQKVWTTTEPQWAEENQPLCFDGYEIERKNGGYCVHQRSFTRELLSKYPDIEEKSHAPALKEYRCSERPGTTAELVSQAQTLAGQLLWLSGRTRPEIGYAVSKMSQMITVDPNEAITRGEQILKFLRHAPDTGLWYGSAPDDYGTFGQLHCRRHHGLVEGYSHFAEAAAAGEAVQTPSSSLSQRAGICLNAGSGLNMSPGWHDAGSVLQIQVSL